MYSSRFLSLSAYAALLSLAVADPDSTCYSNGVDFLDDNAYFINTNSSESFTCVSTFSASCNQDVADVLLVDPNGDEYLCSQVPTFPADTPELSTCPILKNQMISGDYLILILGNNGDGNPFAWQRDISLDCGPQQTTTITPTVTFPITTTPTVTTTSTTVITNTLPPTATYTIPSKTARHTKTVTPKPVTKTSTKTFTRSNIRWTKDLKVTTKTVTASCSVPPKGGKPDKPCKYSPTLVHPAALETPTGTSAPRSHRYVRKADRAVDYEYARSRVEAAKRKRDLKAKAAAAPLEERAPDAPTLTITALTPVNATVTITDPAVTETALATSTSDLQLPPVTIYSGVFTSTTTLPTPTKTRWSFKYTNIVTTKTIHATFTRTTTTTPTASVSACKKLGGHIGPGRW